MTDCWICGAPNADSHEHIIKHSDLKALGLAPTQQNPIFVSNQTRRNRMVGSLKSAYLKMETPICQHCNTARTQPHDDAWTTLFNYLRKPGKMVRCRTIRCNDIFPSAYKVGMRNVQLYLLKHLGAHALRKGIKLDVDGIATAIRESRAHPNIHLQFGFSSKMRNQIGQADALVRERSSDGVCVALAWIRQVGPVCVNVMYAAPGQRMDGLLRAWNPAGNNRCLHIIDFDQDRQISPAWIPRTETRNAIMKFPDVTQ